MNNSKIDIVEDLAAKYFSNEASTEEQERLYTLISDDQELRAIFHEVRRTYHATGTETIENKFNTTSGYKALEQKMAFASKEENTKNRFYALISTSAAAVVLLLGLLYFFRSNSSPTTFATTNIVADTTLADGSIVSLNKQSFIAIDEQFGEGTRKLILEGEAFFKVAHDAKHPFSVQTGNLVITVLGTAFNVNAKTNVCEVTVEEGKVSVKSTTTGKEIILMAGESATYLTDKKEFSQTKIKNLNATAWKTGILTFNQTPIEEVLEALKEQYGMSIELQVEQTHNCLLKATFNNHSLESVLETLKLTFGLSVEKAGNKYVLKGDGC